MMCYMKLIYNPKVSLSAEEKLIKYIEPILCASTFPRHWEYSSEQDQEVLLELVVLGG